MGSWIEEGTAPLRCPSLDRRAWPPRITRKRESRCRHRCRSDARRLPRLAVPPASPHRPTARTHVPVWVGGPWGVGRGAGVGGAVPSVRLAAARAFASTAAAGVDGWQPRAMWPTIMWEAGAGGGRAGRRWVKRRARALLGCSPVHGAPFVLSVHCSRTRRLYGVLVRPRPVCNACALFLLDMRNSVCRVSCASLSVNYVIAYVRMYATLSAGVVARSRPRYVYLGSSYS